MKITIHCQDCSGEGSLDAMDRPSWDAIQPSYTEVRCERCDGSGTVELDASEDDDGRVWTSWEQGYLTETERDAIYDAGHVVAFDVVGGRHIPLLASDIVAGVAISGELVWRECSAAEAA